MAIWLRRIWKYTVSVFLVISYLLAENHHPLHQTGVQHVLAIIAQPREQNVFDCIPEYMEFSVTPPLYGQY